MEAIGFRSGVVGFRSARRKGQYIAQESLDAAPRCEYPN